MPMQAACILLADPQLRGNSAGHGFIGRVADGYSAAAASAAIRFAAAM